MRVRRPGSERGAIGIEFMLILSMLVVVFLVMLQYAVRAHAHRIVTAAAEEGLAAAAAYDGSAEEGRRTAQRYVNDLGPGVESAVVTASRSAETARVTVKGEVEKFVPFLTVEVSAEVEGPVERFVEEAP
jgi:Flp pilus assembly protein TadG